MKERFEGFLSELAPVFGFSSLKPDEKGACLIVLKEDQTALLFELDEQLVPNTILLSCPVSPLPIEARSLILEASLKENGQIEETLSLKPDEEVLYLHRRLYPEILTEDLQKIIPVFWERVRSWRQKIPSLVKEAIPSPSGIKIPRFKA